MQPYLDLYDYRCRVAEFYRQRNNALLANEDPHTVLLRFRQERDTLFATHTQSALDEEQKRIFEGLHYFPFNPAMRFTVTVDMDIEPHKQEVVMNATESMSMTTVGRVQFTIAQQLVTLSLYWLDIYGGGLFLPFRDTTCPKESYGGGRYLFDTIKGSNFLSTTNQQGQTLLTLDFNYAYNPSCAYNDAWTCPLAPVENRLHIAIPAGEKKYKA
ncbi:MAG: DUF1684 domain-containing protein [Ktedonobacteraceae bacterium]